MALAYLYDPLKQWQDLRGVNNVAGWLEVFISGTDEHAVAYSDFNGTLLPERIPIDNDGRAVVIVDSEKAYRVEVHDASGALRFTQYPVWTQVSGGGVIGSFVDIESSDGSVDVVKTTVGATTTYDISVSRDSTELLEWAECNGYTLNDGKMVPTYTSGTLSVGSYGVQLNGGQYYHVTARYIASVTAMPSYNEFTIAFSGRKGNGTSETYVTRYDIADCSTALTQEYEVSFDAMPSENVELYASVSGLETGVSVGLVEVQIHRVFSGVPAIPSGVADKSWVSGNFQQTLSVGDGLELSGSFLSVDYSDVQEKLTAGDNITIENNVISATVPEFAEADWDATSGQPGYIHNKPDLSQYATEAELADKQDLLTAGVGITIENNVISSTGGMGGADWDASSGEPGYIENKPDLSVYAESADLAPVAFSGSYTDLSDTPAIPAAQVNSDWTASSGVAQILHRPDTVDLVAGDNITITKDGSTLTISGEGGADWDATSGEPGYIKNKPDTGLFEARYGQTTYAEIMDAINERKIVFCPGQGVDSVNRMGTLTNFYTNTGSEYVEFEFYKSKTGTGVNDTVVIYRVDGNDNWTMDERDVKAGNISYPVTDVEVNGSSVVSGGVASVTVPAQVQTDWDATSGVSQILNKPTEKSLVAGENITITDSGSTVTISAAGGTQVNADWDATSGAAQILNKPDLSIYAQSADLAAVATTGSYNSLTDKPAIPAAQVNSDWDATSGVSQILHKPDLSIYAQSADLATVATTGSYNSLTDTPVIPAAQVNSDWDSTSGVSQILNKPEETTLTAGENITITESGSTLTISSTSAPQVNADWDATSGVSQILNKPDLSVYAQSADLAAVATTGSYNSLTDTPTIPAAQVNSDWDATSGVQEILNKPDLVDIVAGPGIVVDNPDGNTLRVSMIDTETVLWSGDTGMITSSTDGTCQLSEAATNFERIRVYVRGSAQNINNDTNTATGFSEIVPVSNTDAYYSLSTGMYTNDGSAVHIDTCIVKINGSTFSYSKGLRFSMSGSTPVLNNTRGPFIVKIVGIHRIANN